MTAHTANAIGAKQRRPSARRAHVRTTRTSRSGMAARWQSVDKIATDKEVERVRQQLTWFRAQGFTFAQMENDLEKSGGWCNKVIRAVGRYRVTEIDVRVIGASYRSALRLYKRSQNKYRIMRAIIQHNGASMRCVEELAECV